MSLRRYLLVTYAISVGLLFIGLLGLSASVDGQPSIGGSLLGAALIAIFNVMLNIWPWAQRVPPEKRTGFFAYRATNIFLAIIGTLLLVSSTALILDL